MSDQDDIERIRALAREAVDLCDRIGLADVACHLQMSLDRLPGQTGLMREERTPWGSNKPHRP